MKLLKLRRLVSLVTCFSLVLQSFLPFTLALPAYAVDDVATDSGTVVEAPTSSVTPDVTPEPTLLPEPTVEITPTSSVTPDVTPASTDSAALVVTSENLIDTNSSNSDLLINPEENSITFDNVSVGTAYTSKDGKATVTFTEITGPSGDLTIKEITLTAEQVAEAGAVSEKAYDITSSMIDGTFKFDLTLPKPESGNIEVKYSEDGKDFVTSGGVSTTENEVVVTDVNHFTIFVVVYDALPSVTNTNHASLGFQTTQTSEFGDYIHLGGSNRLLNSVTVTMSNWAKYSTYSSDSRYSGNSSTWSHPITINIYEAQLKADGTPSTKLGTVTQNITIPWRPESSSECGTAWKSSDGNCYNGIAFNAVFDMSSLNLTLPDDIIVGVAYNTNTYGQSPIGSHGPYESLNVAVPEDQTVSVGSDDSVSEVFWNTVTKASYTDGGAAGFGVFRNDTNWSPYGTVAFKIDTIDNTPPVISIGNGNGNLNFGPVDGQAYSGNVDVYASLSDINLYNYHFRVIKDGSVDSHNCGNTLGNSENQGYGKCGYVYNQITSQTTNVDNEIISSLDTTQFGGDGTYWLILGAIDSVGNRAAPNYLNDPRVKIVVDNTAPTATIDGVAPKSLYNGSTSISVHAIDNNYLQTDLYLNNATVPFKTYTGAWFGLFWLSDGNYRMVVRDNADNSTEYTFFIDKTIPSVPELTWPIDIVTKDNTPLMQWDDSTDSGSGIAGYRYLVKYRCTDASDINSCTAVYPNSIGLWLTSSQYQAGTTADGTYYWQVRAQDNAGNQSNWSEAEKVTIDTVAPSAPTITTPGDEDYFKSSPILNQWTSVEDTSGIKEYRIEYVYDDGHHFSGEPYRTTTSTSRSHSPSISEQGV